MTGPIRARPGMVRASTTVPGTQDPPSWATGTVMRRQLLNREAPRNITTYFRHTFTVADAGSIGGLTLNLVRDDGADGVPERDRGAPGQLAGRTGTDYLHDTGRLGNWRR